MKREQNMNNTQQKNENKPGNKLVILVRDLGQCFIKSKLNKKYAFYVVKQSYYAVNFSAQALAFLTEDRRGLVRLPLL